MIEALNSYVAPSKAAVQEPVHATVPVQLPAPHQPAPTAQPVAKKSSLPLIAGIGALVVIVAAIAVYLVTRKARHRPDRRTTPAIVGTWKGTGAGHLEDTLSSVVISGSGNSLTMHAFGTCQPPPCDWGTQPAVVDGQSATATFHRSEEAGSTDTDRVASVSVTPNGGNLDVLVHNTFTEQGKSRSNQARRTFVPGP